MKRLYSVFFGISALLVNLVQASEKPITALSPIQATIMYKAYDEYKDNFINHLPASAKLCQQRLRADQRSISETIDSFSYKNVFVSEYGILKTGMLMASLVGMLTVGNKLNMNNVAYDVANDFAHTIFKDFTSNLSGSLFINADNHKRPRLHPNVEYMVQDIAEKQTGIRQMIHDLSDDAWRNAVNELPANSNRNSQLIENSPLERLKELKKYQLGAAALAVVTAISGFGLYKDIKAMQIKKAELATELQKINNMLTVLEKAQ